MTPERPRLRRGAGPRPVPRPLPWLTLILVTGSLLVPALPGSAGALEYRREAVAAGELWRLATGHLAHWTPAQAGWSAAAFAVLGALCERRSRARFAACLGLAAVLIGAALWWPLAEVERYRGLSGLDSALFAGVAVMLVRSARAAGDRLSAAVAGGLALAFAAKTGVEWVTGGAFFAGELGPGVAPVPAAHVAGALAGALAFARPPARVVGIRPPRV